MNNQQMPDPDQDDQKNVSKMSKEHWRENLIRALYMILFLFVMYVVWIILCGVALIQFIFMMFTKKCNQNLLDFGRGLNQYVYEIFRFLTYNSEHLPYPFSPWPVDKDKP